MSAVKQGGGEAEEGAPLREEFERRRRTLSDRVSLKKEKVILFEWLEERQHCKAFSSFASGLMIGT